MLFSPQPSAAEGAGYAEYYIPGHEQQLWDIFVDLDNDPVLDASQGSHTTIAVATETDNTTIYFDHWEDGYDFDPDAPDPTATADEVYVSNEGDVLIFESGNIPIPRGTDTASVSLTDCAGSACYDGRDRIFTAGGAATVTRTFWPESIGSVFALAFEVYPVKPSTAAYTIPVGEELASGPSAYDDFDSVYIVVQSLFDGNAITIDDPLTAGVDVSVTLQKGEVTQFYHSNTGTAVAANYPVQVQFLAGQGQAGGAASEIRGFHAVANTLWNNAYYVPVGSFSNANSDVFIFNAQTSAITINYEDSSGSGSFSLPAGATYAYSDSNAAGRLIPPSSAVYLQSDDVFWGIASVDSEGFNYDWGYSLVPANILEDEYFLGWAPGTRDLSANGSPVFVTPVLDNTTIFVDYSPADGAADASFNLDRLDSQKIYDESDNDNSGMRVWGTGPFAMAWGQDPDTAYVWDPYLDLGYAAVPMREDWLDAVVGIAKTASPENIPIGAGQVTTFTLAVSTFDYTLDDVVVTDTLPIDWAYVPDSAAITLPGGVTIGGNDASPTVAGQTLSWDSIGGVAGQGLDMSAGETLTITLQAVTTAQLGVGFSTNKAQAAGTRPAGAANQVFIASDSVDVYTSDVTVSKQSSAPDPLLPGDIISYTITVANIGTVPQTNMTVTDPLPAGVTYITNTAQVTAPAIGPIITFSDTFADAAYNNSYGSGDWSGDFWTEINDDNDFGAGKIQINNDRLVFRGTDNSDTFTVTRALNLAGAVTANLSFDYWEQGRLEGADRVTVSVHSGGAWYDLLALANDFGSIPTTFSQAISNYASADFQLRIVVNGFAGGNNPGERFFLDNVLISTQSVGPPVTLPGAAPPVIISAADGYNLSPGQALTVTFQVTVDDPLNPALASLVNVASASSDQQLAPITDADVNLVQTCFGPGAPTVSAAQLDATTLRLSWPAVAGAGEYRVYRGTTPYFTPTEPAYQVLTSTTFDDPGVIGDPNTQYYYVVQSACTGGASSGDSNRVGAYDFGLSSPGAANYNDIAMVFDMPDVPDAVALASHVGSSVTRVLRFNGASQSYQTYIVGLFFTNFTINAGDYLFLLTNASAPATVSLVGNVPDPGAVSFNLTAGSGVAYNAMSLPLDQGSLTTAAALAADIGSGALRVLRFRGDSQTYQTYISGLFFTDFTIAPGEPLFILAGPGVPANWP